MERLVCAHTTQLAEMHSCHDGGEFVSFSSDGHGIWSSINSLLSLSLSYQAVSL